MQTAASLAMLVAAMAGPLSGAEIARLDQDNWERLAPRGKEVDCIYGDYVLRNDRVVAVVAQPGPTRHANMTVKQVGGMLIDLTQVDDQRDQLSAFYPGGGRQRIVAAQILSGDRAAENQRAAQGRRVALRCDSQPGEGWQLQVTYELRDGERFVRVHTKYVNSTDKQRATELGAAVRCDRDFQMVISPESNLFSAYDPWWRQAYGIVPLDARFAKSTLGGRPFLKYAVDGQPQVKVAAGKTFSFSQLIFPGADVLQIKALAAEHAGTELSPVGVEVRDPDGPVAMAQVKVMQGDREYGSGRTDEQGRLNMRLPAGRYRVDVAALGRGEKSLTLDPSAQQALPVALPAAGYVVAKITDAQGGPIPCKVEFRGAGDTTDPYFGPDTYEQTVHNLYYSHDGRFRQPLGPGTYDVIISHGPEHDAIFTQIEVARGKPTPLTGKLVRSVETRGWVSGEYHSHSSPSGDNTSSQRGRVLNLLAEHIEFAPCTEHNRISSYVPHLEELGAVKWMATCSGIELTGSPLPVNHHNAFPLIHKPRTQDGGAPQTDANPIVQIERIAMWDDGSQKLVQQNHPNLVQIVGDRNADAQADGGFEKMFGWMDVVEVHPPGRIFSTLDKLPTGGRDRGNPIFHWLQLLNLGYRIPGVVNTDAHYNFHGSGWLRNYIKSSTDDPAEIDTLEMVHASERGNLVMTNGPFLEVELLGGDPALAARTFPGDDRKLPEGRGKLRVKVQCPNWLDVNRVQVFVNGRPSEDLHFTRKTTPDAFGSGVVKFEQDISLNLKSDAHLIVAAAGEGLTLGPVMGPRAGAAMPVAVSNPIYVDVDGQGFQPNGDMLGLPLPVPKNHRSAHAHQHHKRTKKLKEK